MAGLSRTHLSRIEKGRRHPCVRTRMALDAALAHLRTFGEGVLREVQEKVGDGAATINSGGGRWVKPERLGPARS